MAVPRIFSSSRCLLFRGTPSIRIAPSKISTIRIPISRRQLSTSTPLWEDIVQTPSRGPEIALTDARITPTGPHAQSIALLRLPTRLTKSDIEELLRGKGCNIKRLQMRLDRFTFHNDSMCFVELGSEEEAAKAIEQLDKVDLQGKKIVVMPLKADFQWGPLNNGNKGPSPYGSHYFYDERNGAEEALRPLGEGRRILLHVQTPGWTSDVVGNQSRDAIQIIQETFDQYGIEKIGKISPFYGDKQKAPRLLCFMDFKTKEGTDEAIQKHHDTEIKGRLTWLTRSSPVSWRTHQFAKVVPQLVAQLQEQGILSKEPRPDKFANPLPGTESK